MSQEKRPEDEAMWALQEYRLEEGGDMDVPVLRKGQSPSGRGRRKSLREEKLAY